MLNALLVVIGLVCGWTANVVAQSEEPNLAATTVSVAGSPAAPTVADSKPVAKPTAKQAGSCCTKCKCDAGCNCGTNCKCDGTTKCNKNCTCARAKAACKCDAGCKCDGTTKCNKNCTCARAKHRHHKCHGCGAGK